MKSLLLLCFTLFVSWANAQPGDRTPYIEFSKSRIHAYLTSFHQIAVHDGSLSQAEKILLEKLINFIAQNKTQTENQNEVRDFGVPFEFSSDQSLFSLDKSEPIRTAVTTAEPNSPVYFNLKIINEPTNRFGLSDALQVIIHELGRKVAKPSEMATIDSIAAKFRKEITPYLRVVSSEAHVKITVPITWHTLYLSGPSKHFPSELILFFEKNGRVSFYKQQIFYPSPLISGLFYDPNDSFPVGPLRPEENSAKVSLTQAFVNPSWTLVRKILQITDIAHDPKNQRISLRIQMENSLAAGLLNPQAFAVMGSQFEFFKVHVEWQEKRPDLINWSTSITRENDFAWIDLTGIQTRTSSGVNGNILFQVQFQNKDYREAHLLLKSDEVEFLVPANAKPGQLGVLEFNLTSDLISQPLVATALILDRKKKVYFDSEVEISSLSKTPRPASDMKLVEASLLSAGRAIQWSPTSALDFEKPGANAQFPLVAGSVTCKFLLNGNQPIKILKLNWQELFELQRKQRVIGYYRLNRQTFLTDSEFKQEIKNGFIEVTVPLPETLSLQDSEVTSFKKEVQRFGLELGITNTMALTQVTFTADGSQTTWSEFRTPQERSYYVLKRK